MLRLTVFMLVLPLGLTAAGTVEATMPWWAATGEAWGEKAAQCGAGGKRAQGIIPEEAQEWGEMEWEADEESEEECSAQATVHVRDLAESASVGTEGLVQIQPQVPLRGLLAGGFAVLSPTFPSNRFGREALKAALRRRDQAGAFAELASSSGGLRSLGYTWVGCGVAAETRTAPGEAAIGAADASQAGPRELLRVPGPAAAMLRDLLLSAPWAVQLLKVWLPVRVPVQPLAMLDLGEEAGGMSGTAAPGGSHPGMPAVGRQDSGFPGVTGGPLGGLAAAGAIAGRRQWWWHGGLKMGDAVVLDALRCPHTSFTLPGEELLVRTCEATERLRAALEHGMPEEWAQDGAPLRHVLDVCGGLGATSEDPAPFPRVGGRYIALVKPTALMRLHENIESDVFAELRPGGIVTVLEVGIVETNRARVFTDDAKPVQLQHFEDGGDFSDSRRHEGSITGWITSALYNGTPLLAPAPAAPGTFQQEDDNKPSEYVLGRLTKMSATLRGICHWANVSLEKAEAGKPSDGQIDRLRLQYAQILTAHLDDAHRVAVEAQCVAFLNPGRTHLVAAISGSAALVACGAALRLWLMRTPPPQNPSSQDLY